MPSTAVTKTSPTRRCRPLTSQWLSIFLRATSVAASTRAGLALPAPNNRAECAVRRPVAKSAAGRAAPARESALREHHVRAARAAPRRVRVRAHGAPARAKEAAPREPVGCAATAAFRPAPRRAPGGRVRARESAHQAPPAPTVATSVLCECASRTARGAAAACAPVPRASTAVAVTIARAAPAAVGSNGA